MELSCSGDTQASTPSPPPGCRGAPVLLFPSRLPLWFPSALGSRACWG